MAPGKRSKHSEGHQLKPEKKLTKWQRVALLFQLVQWFNLIYEVIGRKVVQLIRRLCVAEDNYEGPVEKLRAVDFDLICERVAGELCNVSLQVQNVQT